MKKPYHCFCNHIKTYKQHYIIGLFGSFAIIKLVLLVVGFLGTQYNIQYHASAAGPEYINPTLCTTQTPDVSEAECDFLTNLYNSTEGSQWTNSTNWSDTDISAMCTWKGIDCDTNHHIISLTLPNNNLNGSIPSTIQHLKRLEELDISYNKITTLPDTLDSLLYVTSLDTSYNLLASLPDTLGKMKSLSYLNVSANQITTLPETIGDGGMPLIEFYAHHNYIAKLPDNISNLSQLKILDVSYNLLTDNDTSRSSSGTDALKSITSLNFAHNNINNIASTWLNLMDTLIDLDFSYNMISDITPIKGEKAPLQQLYLRHNHIATLPSFKNLGQLILLDLGKNMLDSGSVVPVTSLPILRQLGLDHNRIDSLNPSFGQFEKNNRLRYLDLSYNYLQKVEYITAITSLNTLLLSNNQLSSTFSIEKLSSLHTLDLGFNKFGGDMSPFVDRLSPLKSQLTFLGFKHNNFDKSIPNTMQNFTHPDFICDISYNRLESYKVTDPTLINFLDTHCTHDGQYSFENSNRNRQYRYINTNISSKLADPNTTIYPGDDVDIIITTSNEGDKDSDILDIHIYDQPGVFTVISPVADTLARQESNFNGNDTCRQSLLNGDGPYKEALDLRATNNNFASFTTYLNSSRRDYDHYLWGTFGSYPESRGSDLIYTLSLYHYDALDTTLQGGLFSWLFDIDLNDLAYNDGIHFCGEAGVTTHQYDRGRLAVGQSQEGTYTIRIDPNFVGTFNLTTALNSDNRLFIEEETKNNKDIISIDVKENPPVCGNNIKEGSEECDGTDLGGMSCTTLGLPRPAQSISITTPVSIDNTTPVSIDKTTPVSIDNTTPVSIDSLLAQGTLGSNSLLDSSSSNNSSSPTGFLTCTASCTFDSSACIAPLCTGTPVTKCADISTDCSTHYSTSENVFCRDNNNSKLGGSCIPGHSCTIPPVCGNNILETGEMCDGTLFSGGATCSSYGYSQGTLSCSSCQIDSSPCSNILSSKGGGGGGGSMLHKDICPNGDLSPSYYDGICTTSVTSTHNAASEANPSNDIPITRKVMAQFVSTFAQEILGLIPDPTRPCEFGDIENLSPSEQKSITDACMLNIMGVHKNGIAIKTDFEPGKYIDEKEFAAALSRTIYDGTYNLNLDSPIARYVNHITQIKKIGLLPTGPRVMLSFTIKTFDTIKNNLSLVKRPDTNIHAAASITPTTSSTGSIKTGTNVITSPATSVSSSLRLMFQDLKKFFILKPYNLKNTTEHNVEETHAVVEETHAVAEETPTTPTMTELIKFMQFFK